MLNLCFQKEETVDSIVCEQMMDLFRLYLIVGGMPAAVAQNLKTYNLKEVKRIQKINYYFIREE